MKIVIDIRHLTKPEPSGIGQYTMELLRALFELDRTNDYVLFSSGSKRARTNLPTFSYPNVKHFHLDIPNRLFNALLLATGRPRFDKLIADKSEGGERPLFFFPNLNIISLSPGAPYVLTLHDLSFEIFPEFYQAKARLWHCFTRARALAQKARAVIVPSKSAARDIGCIFRIPKEKIFVVPHGVSPAFSSRPAPQDHGVKSRYNLPKKFALFVGTLEPRKNIAAMIEAVAAYCRESGDDLRLVLAGKPTGHKTTAAATATVVQTGYVRPQDLPALYRLATVTLFPSLYEGFGLPIIESMASGTPVIAGKTSSMPEVGGRAAIYVDPYNKNDLVAALRELLSNEEFKKQKIAEGLEWAKRFSWKKAAEQTITILNKISVM